jgi:rod shape determining protein RodA
MRRQDSLFRNADWGLVSLYLILVLMGWLNIYASVYNEEHQSISDLSQKYGKQLIWIISSLLIAFIIFVIDEKFYTAFAYPLYGVSLVSLILVLFLGTEVSGSKSWFRFGEFGIQPAEFAKFATNIALAKYLSSLNIQMQDRKTKIISILLIVVPIVLILMENETGCALVFLAFIFVLYREGLSGNILLIGVLTVTLFILTLLFDKLVLISIVACAAFVLYLVVKKTRENILVIVIGFVLSAAAISGVNYAFDHLGAHQKKRINVFLGKEIDVKKAGYNVNQSLIAIGSGGLAGKGYLNGTQTKYDFVPEQSTDFIFCTVGEEWGFLGALVVIVLFLVLLLRIVNIAERQRSPFSRIYGYGVASIIFFHLTVNVGMTIGLAPVIGIPLPFFSYGGSSLWSFTILLFIFIKLDSNRLDVLR